MAPVLEKEIGTKALPEKEEKYLDLPPYKRDGMIPAWGEVVNRFELRELHPRDFRLLRSYYREQKRIAQGRNKKAQRLYRCLAKNPDFLALEKDRTSLFNNIASFVRKKS